jgi:predicted amino acid-binding ACT domain protein
MALHSESALLSGGGEDEYKIQSKDLQGAVNDLSLLGTIDIVPDMAIVSLVGKQLKNMIGISGRFFSVLGQNNINIEMISQGMSSFLHQSQLYTNPSQVRARSTSLVSLKSARPIALSMLYIQIFLPS